MLVFSQGFDDLWDAFTNTMSSLLKAGFACLVTLSGGMLLGAADPVPVPELPARVVAPTDHAEFRHLVLDNGLRVLLVSDRDFNKSAAALVVGVGQLEDPAEATGMAHFTEHMLFLGTEKYPDEASYSGFIHTNGGSNNAYTSSDHTNYQFEIRHEALDEALDRLSQFFIAPLFTPQFTAREVKAVDSEVMRHIQNDSRRIYNVKRELFTPGSPESRFTAGNLKTLSKADSDAVRAFFLARYSADRMALAITGKASLDDLERMARAHFSAIPKRELAPLTRKPEYLPREQALRLAKVQPVREIRELQLEFVLPGIRQAFASKPDDLLSLLINNPAPGGLLDSLKADGLALSLSAGVWDRCSEYGALMLNISLTPEGEKRYPEVLSRVFNYFAFLRSAPFPAEHYRELASVAALQETYGDRGEGVELATRMANQALFYPLAVAERAPSVWGKPDEPAYRSLLAALTPDNMLAVLAARGVPTDRKEEFYGSEYSYSKDSGPAYQALVAASKDAGTRFQLPSKNPFIVENPALLTERPVLVADRPGLKVLYAPDLEFQRPQTSLVLRFVPVRALASCDNAMLLSMYSRCLNDALEALASQAEKAGVTFTMKAELDGLRLQVNGFGESPVIFARQVARMAPHLETAEARFLNLREAFVRSIKSFPQTEAYRMAGLRREAFTKEFAWLPTDWSEKAPTLTPVQVKTFATQFFAQGKLEVLVHGHLSAEQSVAAAEELAAILGHKPAAPESLLRVRELEMQAGETLVDAGALAGANSVYTAQYLLPSASAEMRAAAVVLGNFVAEPFFSELRTHQQLGYVVGANGSGTSKSRFLYFVIQSSNYTPDDLRTRAEAFIATLPEALAKLPAAEYATLVAGARSTVAMKPKSIEEKAERFFSLGYEYDGDWNRINDTLAALDGLSQEKAVSLLKAALTSPEVRRRVSVLNGDKHPASATPASFSSRDAWKATRQFR